MMRVHQAESVPWKVMKVWITPWISTPRRVPGRKATPPDISVPPITEEAMASISMLTAWRGYPESMMRE